MRVWSRFYSLFRDRYFSTLIMSTRGLWNVSIRCFATGTSRRDGRGERANRGFYSLFRDRYFSTAPQKTGL